jgi:class 3 adenylate cyclase
MDSTASHDPDASAVAPNIDESVSTSPLVAFLLSDVAGSARLWEQQAETMSVSMRTHDRVVHAAVTENEGRIFKSLGDGFYAVFSRVSDALSAAIAIHGRLESAEWNQLSPLRLRMAIHCGTAEERDDDYFGPTVNRAARLVGLALPGQLLLSRAAFALVEDSLPTGAT